VSLLRTARRQLSTHPDVAHLCAPPIARLNPSACTLTAGMWSRDHTLAPRLATSHRVHPWISPQGTLFFRWQAERTRVSHGMCNRELLHKGLGDWCVRWTWLITADAHPGCLPTVCPSSQDLCNPCSEFLPKKYVLLKGATKGSAPKPTEN
jgi:hypothetical protein